MTHEGNPSLISLDLSYHLERDDASLRRWLVGSLVFHLVVALVAINLRFSPTIEQPLSSYEVSLVSLPALEKATPSRTKAKSVKRRPRKAQPKPRPKEKTLPPLPTKTASERLSESFAGAAQSIVVPKTRTSQPESKPIPQVKTSSNSSAALENIKLPSQAPSLTTAERLAPRKPVRVPKRAPKKAAKSTPPAPKHRPTPKKKSSPPKMNLQEAMKGIKAPPKAPALAPLQPFTKASEVEPSPTKPDQLSQSLKEKIQSVHIPKRPKQQVRKTNKTRSQARRTKKDPPQPEKKRERLADSLKEVLESVNVPKLRDVSKTPPRRPEPVKPQSVKPDRTPSVSNKFRTEIDQQLAKLKIPDVAPIESIRTRLQLQEVKQGDSESASSSTASSSSKNSKGQNRYLGLVQAKIDQQWVAPPVAANEDNLQVVLKFRILRSGAVTNLGIDQGSGNPYYDSAAKRAVQAADPLPPFPSDITDSYLDVRYNFILGDSSS